MLNRVNKQTREGFTLVELLVVLTIIALLMGLILPALANARQNAINVQCQNNLRQIGTMLVEYSNVSDGFMPAGEDLTSPTYPYYDYSDALFSFYTGGPAESRYSLTSNPTALAVKYAQIFRCPAVDVPDTDKWADNYACNINAFKWHYTFNFLNLYSVSLTRVGAIQRPSDTIAITDANQVQTNGDSDSTLYWFYYDAPFWTQKPLTKIPSGGISGEANMDATSSSSWLWESGMRFRHMSNSSGAGYANALFFDGHVEAKDINTIEQMNVATSY